MTQRASKGYYQIQSLYVVSHNNKRYDFESNFETLNYEESIFDTQVSHGEVEFLESNDILRTLPIVGGEKLVFEYKVASETPTITKNFIVYKTATVTDSTSVRTKHTLSFVSEELVASRNKSISRSYKNKTSVEIVKDLFKEVNQTTSSKIKTTEKTKGSHHIIVPNMKPIEAINLIASITQHPSHKSGLFFFYENSYGFNFYCIEELMSKKPLAQFQKNNQTVDTGVREKAGSILDFEQYTGNPDLLSAMHRGMFASKFIAYDPLIKSYKEVKYDYSKNFKDTSSLNEFKLTFNNNAWNSPDQKVTYLPSNTMRNKSTYISSIKTHDVSHSNGFEDFCHYSNSVFEQIFSKHYRIRLKGDDVSSLWEDKSKVFTIGETITLNHPTKSFDKDVANTPHTYINGKYLVHWCRHMFTKTNYAIEARIISDSNVAAHERGK